MSRITVISPCLFLSFLLVAGCATEVGEDLDDTGPDVGEPDDDDGDDVAPVEWIRIGGNADSEAVDLSGDGYRLAFTSLANDLVAGDDNEAADAFVFSMADMKITRVSVASTGAQATPPKHNRDADKWTRATSISTDGMAVSFTSYADNLVWDDTNKSNDLFVHHLAMGDTERVNVGPDGAQADWDNPQGELSGDGRFVTFYSHATSLADDTGCVGIYTRDQMMNTISVESVTYQGHNQTGCSYWGDGYAAISADADAVAFTFRGGFLVEDVSTDYIQVYLRDHATGATELVSMSDEGYEGEGGSAAPQLSNDGQLVAFESKAVNLVSDDTNGATDIFVRDRLSNTTQLISVGAAGEPANGESRDASVSGDGRYVAFVSSATNLVAGDMNEADDVFVFDRETGAMARVSAPEGGEADGGSMHPVISGNGRVIAFTSSASNLLAGDDNGMDDIFVAPNPLAE